MGNYNVITVDAKKFDSDSFLRFARGWGKTNLQLAYLMAYLESKETGNPVSFECGFELVNVEDL